MTRSPFYTVLALILVPASVLLAQKVPGRYIVELQSEPVLDHVAASSTGSPLLRSRAVAAQMRSTAALAYRARLQNEHASLRAAFQQRNAKVLGSVDTVVNALFVQAPDEATAAQLANVPGVKRVLPARVFRPLLDRAVVLHRVVDAWTQVGSQNAGLGMKIAIIDTGIDITQPGLQDASLKAPDGFPRANADADLAYTNSKVIVARSYVGLLPYDDPDKSPQDHVGHGTALGMTSAGVQAVGPLATITGVAPKAYLGSYKVFGTPGFNDSATDDAILKAMDDAVADGMDVINLSLGANLAPRIEDDLDAQAVERAAKAGVIVVVAAGNNGSSWNTISSPATAPSALSVGASTNDRTFATGVQISGLDTAIAGIPGNGAAPSSPVTGPIGDVSSVDGSGLACSALKPGSLNGEVALILRGSCTFETKLNNVQAAGAIGGIVYAAETSPDPIPMDVGASSLPSQMVANGDGLKIKQALADNSSATATMNFTLTAVPAKGNRLAFFSASGPNVDNSIKPDLVAVGENFYIATQTFDPNGEMYDPTGFILVDGTSFSTPLVSGAAAVLKAARPGLTVDQYRSLLINSAATVQSQNGGTAVLQAKGAGSLDLYAALNGTVTAFPASLSFGAGNADTHTTKTLTLTNVSGSDDTFTITVAPTKDGAAPTVGNSTIRLAAGASADVPVEWNANGLSAGTYDGSINVVSSSGTMAHIPYWFALGNGTPVSITILSGTSTARRSRLLRDAVQFRVVDASGVALTGVTPDVTVVSGGGTVRIVRSEDDSIPGLFGVDLQLGAKAGANVFHIQAGDASADISITGQ